jgi:phosphate transport system permease protein
MASLYVLCLAGLVLLAFYLGRGRADSAASHSASLHSRPSQHGLLLASMVLLIMLGVFVLGWALTGWIAEQRALAALPADLRSDPLRLETALRAIVESASGRSAGASNAPVETAAASYAAVIAAGRWLLLLVSLLAGVGVLLAGLKRISRDFRARNHFEAIVTYCLFASAGLAVLTTIGIVFSVAFETFRFFQLVSPVEFLFGLEWNPQTALRADQGEFGGAFGIVPLIVGTLLITLIAMCVAGPIGLTAAIYMAEYASPRMRAVIKPMLEILAGIPTVVLGFFAALTVAPHIRDLGTSLGLSVASESALAAGLVMGMMIIPFVSSLSDDVINAVPQSLRDGSYAMGSTKSETIKKVVLPAALPGIVSAFMLGISRAIGETMIVVMAAGLAANLTFNPLEAVTTFTVQIKTILVGDQEFDSAKTLSAFALGFVLFFLTLVLNVIALRIVNRYRELYD